MTHRDPGERRGMRLALAAVVVVDLASFVFAVLEARSAATARGEVATSLYSTLSHPLVVAGIAAVGVAGAAAFALRAGRIWSGMTALIALSVLSSVHGQLFGSPWRHLYFSGVSLAGWLVGLVALRARADRVDESYARLGAIALLGSAYLNSGISKLVYGGFDWLSGTPVQAAVIAQDGLVSGGAIGAVRVWSTDPTVAQSLAIATVVLELSGPLMLLGRLPRALVAAGIAAMHLNIWTLTGIIIYWESIVLLLLFGFSADDARGPVTVARPRWYVPVAVLLSGAALLAVVHQGRRFERTREILVIPQPPVYVFPEQPTAIPSPTVPAPSYFHAELGPFSVGEDIAGWRIEALNLRNGGFVATLAGDAGEVRLIVTCAESTGRGMFDIDDVRILYSSDLRPDQFLEVGNEFRERVRRATEGRDVCEAVAEWQERVLKNAND